MTETDKQTEERIFDAATEVFIEKGMDGARMQDIADRAGINKALLHYYYRTKDHLFNAVYEMIAGQMFKKFGPVLDENLTLEQKIRFFLREHITFLQKNPKLPSFILNEIHRNPDRIRKLIQRIDINKLWNTLESQHREELKRYNITKENLPQFMTTIAGMSVFPFAAKPIIASIMEKMGYNFDDYIEHRKEYAADFIINAIIK
ncbi:MAG TPA: TetR/AcrR family transcriptional regulator [Bacteroidales bacterium]|jgi:TetR/AcrR family transcriptional regulator|nr:TetR/AcrR family transcriptional regulator [Bacteroidales bacterium]HBZ22214.1 TetR/AcrR family transcriptional regulator [Bacteroidales bacterium]